MAGKERDNGCIYLVLLILLITQSFTFYCLTNINVRYTNLQEDCSTEIRERETQIKVAAEHAVELEGKADTCSKNSRQAATVGATWLSIVADVNGVDELLPLMKALMASIIVETPLRSFPPADIHLFSEEETGAVRELRQESSVGSWVESGRLTLNTAAASHAPSVAQTPPFPGAPTPHQGDMLRTVRMGKALEAMQGRCEYAMLMDFTEQPVLCQHAFPLMRYAVARADSYWGSWSALRFSGGLSGTVLACNDLAPLARFLSLERHAAPLPHLLAVYFSGDVAKFPALSAYVGGSTPVPTPLFFRQNLVHRPTTPAACGAEVILDQELAGPHKFEPDKCGFTDLSPCAGKLKDDWLRIINSDSPPLSPSAPLGAPSANTPQIQGVPYMIAELGESCDTACARGGGRTCDATQLDKLNNCQALQEAFKCTSCGDNEGPDQPAQEDAGPCLVKGSHKDFVCSASHPKTRRLCVCQ